MSRHAIFKDENVHRPFRHIFADSTARLADATSYAADDLYKFALQTDDASMYYLSNIAPITWTAVASGGGTNDHNALSNLTVGHPHTQYQQVSEKDQATGYAGLDGSSKLDGAQQVYGTIASTACEGNDARLSDSRAPNGAASGDLGDTFPGPTVTGIQGQSVSATSPTEGQSLVSVGGVWTPATPAGGGGNVNSPGGETAATVAQFTGSNAIDDTSITIADLATLTDGSDADGLHTHPSLGDFSGPGSSVSGNLLSFNGTSGKDGQDSGLAAASVSTAVTHAGVTTGNPHNLDSADVGADPVGTASTAVSNHESAGDPHTVYQLKSEKDQAAGYAGLDGSSKLDGAQQVYGALASTACEGNDARLSDSRAPNGAASGDLGDTFPGPTVTGIQGQSVSATSPTEGQALISVGGVWTPATPAGGGGNVNSPGGETAATVAQFTGSNAIDDTTITVADLTTLTDGSDADSLHTHPSLGDFSGPGSSVSGNLLSFNGTSGKDGQDSGLSTSGVSAAVTHAGVTTGNPHNLDAADVGAEPAGDIATHAANANAHHSELHTIASHSDTSATGPQLDTLTDGSNADALHVHATPTIAHAATTGQTADDHHSELHTIASHNDTVATGAQLNTLVAGTDSDASPLHTHDDLENNININSKTGLHGLPANIITVNAENNALFDIEENSGHILDFSVDPASPVHVELAWTDFVGVTVDNLATQNQTFLYIENTGTVEVPVAGIFQSNTAPTPELRRSKIYLGAIVHTNTTSIQAVASGAVLGFDVGGELDDLWTAFGNRIESGCAYSENGANLLMDRASGIVIGRGLNEDVTTPNRKALGVDSPIANYFYNYRSGGGYDSTALAAVDPTQWDDDGTLTAVPNNDYTIQPIYLAPRSGVTSFGYGQAVYDKIDKAIDGIAENGVDYNPLLTTETILWGWLVIREDVTDLAQGLSQNRVAIRPSTGITSQPSGAGSDPDAVHVNGAAEISNITNEPAPADGDVLILERLADSFTKRSVTAATLLAPTEKTAAKDQASGYAGLDGSSKLDGAQQTYGALANTACEGNDARLSDSRSPNGSASGDLGDSFPGPTVIGIQGEDVSATTPTEGQTLIYTSGTWTPTNPAAGGAAPSLIAYARTTELDGLDTTPITLNYDQSNADAVTGLFEYNDGVFTASKALKITFHASYSASYSTGTNPVILIEVKKNAAVIATNRASCETAGAKTVLVNVSSATLLAENDEISISVYTSEGSVDLVAMTPTITMSVYET